MKAKHDKSVWQPEVEILLDLKKKLTNLKSNMNAPEKKSPAKNKKGESTHVPEQNGDALTDVALLESAIAKQVLDHRIYYTILFFLIIYS